MEEKILEILSKGKDYSALEISEQLKLAAKEYTQLVKTLNKLIDEDKVFLNEHERYELMTSQDSFKGDLIVKRNGKSFVLFRGELIEVKNAIKFNCLNNDEIVYRVSGHTASVVRVIKHNLVYVVGLIRIKRGKTYFSCDDPSFPKGYKIINYDQFDLRDNVKVRCYISDYQKKQLRIEKVLGFAYSSEVRELSILYSHDISTEFTSTCLNEAKLFTDDIKVEDYKDRHDCTDELIITIDGDDAKDFDDAIFIEKDKDDNYTLKVHIADVSHYVTVNSAIDKEALKRGTSIYYPGHVIPMLPNVLSDELCSLQPNKNRLAMTCEMHYDPTGDMTSYDIYKSVIRSKYRMTYNKVNAIFEGDEKLIKQYSGLLDMLANARELSDKLKAKSAEKGSIDFESDDCDIILDKQGKVVDVKAAETGLSQGIIECFMIEANKTVASHMRVLEYPMVYRNHDHPKPEKIEVFYNLVESLGYHFKGKKDNIYPKQLQDCLNSFKDSLEYPIISTFLLRSMAKAKYENESIGHFGLGLEDYCHFTSPIRRYPDLQVHRMLKKYVISQPDYSLMPQDKYDNALIAKKSSEREVEATKIERDITDLLKCEYMSRHVNETFMGVISSTTTYGFYVKLENTIEGLVHISTLQGFYQLADDGSLSCEEFNKSYKIGQIVKVRCVDVNLLRQDIDFELVRERKKKNKSNF